MKSFVVLGFMAAQIILNYLFHLRISKLESHHD